ncbi:MAG: uracil phosphoribosyltransferase [Verrucomicrobia bacterium]|jgi:uracil phosphoribosyltransferase|nr:uracil phosphoribosyltransferase [Verrucomicrobiota bacterium]MBT7066679.1 uracil phosphoribosyltransferase [Verrucomicrobiota bacterium]
MHTNVNVIKHPLLEHSLTILRDRDTQTATFRQHSKIVSTLLVVEAAKSIATAARAIETPLAAMEGAALSEKVIVVPVLRAGLAMLFAAQDLLLDVPVGFLGLERDEETAVAREYYQKFPGRLDGYKALILDPMLATGGSLDETVQAVERRGCNDISMVCVVAAPEGIDRVMERHSGVTLHTGAIDERLDENKYIVPGLGDFGDRYFGT